MRLAALKPAFLRRERVGEQEQWATVDTVAEADGVIFTCPKCFTDKGDTVGVHSIVCWRPRVPLEVSPGPGRWEFDGTGFDDLTFRASGMRSVQLMGGCAAHLHVTDGMVHDA